jgi:hypothetical protein
MERKGGSTAVVTAEMVKSSLKQATFTTLEERILRMRYAATVQRDEVLPTAYGDNEDLKDELELLEMRLLKALKMRKAMTAKAVAAPAPRNATKDRIVAKLKSKKK